MSSFSLNNLEVEAQRHALMVEALKENLANYSPECVLSPTDGVLSFTYRQIRNLVEDCKRKCSNDTITPSYLKDLQKHIRELLQQAKERSQIEDLSIVMVVANKVLCAIESPTHSVEHLTEERPQIDDFTIIEEVVNKILCEIESPTHSVEHLETTATEEISVQCVNQDIGDPDAIQLGIESDIIEGSTLPKNTDTGICETSEISEYYVIKTSESTRKPHKSDYKTLRFINRGGFGSVHLVRHEATDQLFAMKKMEKKNLDEKTFMLVLQERDIQIFADCPFVVPMYSSFPSRDHLCMVMEYIRGGDCRSLLLKKGRFPVTLARQYIAETILAVEYLHSCGIVHRDLKTENLLISSTGHIKVTDFGLSKLGLMGATSGIYKAPMEEITKEFHNDKLYGTPYYLAPEFIIGTGYGRAVDWWACGILLYEFLIGSVPFDGESIQDICDNIVKDDIIWDWDTDIPPDAQDMITELLRKDPKHRLGTGGAHELKSHPFMSGVDFDNILNQTPEYIPELVSDEDTSNSSSRSEGHPHVVSESEEDSSEDEDDEPIYQNFTSSSHRLSELYATHSRMIGNEEPKSSEECVPAEDPEMQKQSPPGEDIRFKADGEEPYEVQEEQEENGNTESRNRPRGLIIRRFLASCRRRLRRAARAIGRCCIFACCRSTTSI